MPSRCYGTVHYLFSRSKPEDCDMVIGDEGLYEEDGVDINGHRAEFNIDSRGCTGNL